MYSKRRMQRIGIVLLFLGVGALGAMIVLFLFMTNPEALPLLPTQEPATQSVPPSPTPSPDWKLTFEYRFTSTNWETGSHPYQLQIRCPASGTASWSGSLTVSDSAELRFERVYLRTRGVYDQASGGAPVNTIHPNQSVGAAVTLSYQTLNEAEAARGSCEAHVRLGRGPWEPMQPLIPVQE